MSDNKRADGGVIIAVALIALGVWLLMGRVLGDWWGPVRQAFSMLANVAFPLSLIAIGVLLLLAAQGRLGRIDYHGRRLYRSREERMLAGVLGGLADMLGIDPTIVRIVYVIFGFVSGGAALVLYIIAAIVIPEAPVGGAPAAPVWPTTGHESVQTPPTPPAPPVPDAPAPPRAPEPPA